MRYYRGIKYRIACEINAHGYCMRYNRAAYVIAVGLAIDRPQGG